MTYRSMSDRPIDPGRGLPRVTYALVRGTDDSDTEVLIAGDDESVGQALALEVVANTAPVDLGPALAEIRDALMERRWADALVLWMAATGRVVDIYPDEPVRRADATDDLVELEFLMKPIFRDSDE